VDIFKKIIGFYGEIMSRKDIMERTSKKKAASSKKSKSSIGEKDVANLAVNLLEIYKTSCQSQILEFKNLETAQIRELCRVLDNQENVMKSRLFDQVSLLFK